MESTARLFNCARCRCQVAICSTCDRGNIYCGPNCSRQARRASMRAAGRGYQHSRRGRFTHAERQRRYRARQQKVTHQGSPPSPSHDSPAPTLKGSLRQNQSHTAPAGDGIRCHLCAGMCSAFVRLDFLRGRPHRRTNRKPTVGAGGGQGP